VGWITANTSGPCWTTNPNLRKGHVPQEMRERARKLQAVRAAHAEGVIGEKVPAAILRLVQEIKRK
jgi:hypothetical protein